MVFVTGLEHQLNHFPGMPTDAFAFQLRRSGYELRPRHRRFFRHYGGAFLQLHSEPGICPILRVRAEALPQFVGSLPTDSGQQLHEALERKLIARVHHEF